LAVIDDFRQVVTSVGGKVRTTKYRQEKGHGAELAAFARVLTEGGLSPISWQQMRAVSHAAFLAVQSVREGIPLEIPH
jgi:hypothetical protein